MLSDPRGSQLGHMNSTKLAQASEKDQSQKPQSSHNLRSILQAEKPSHPI